jgi:CHAD domain-containing protein
VPADTPIVDSLRQDVGDHVRKLKKRLGKARKGDPEGVHDARTLLRRIRVEVDIMGRTAFDPAQAERLDGRLRTIEKALSAERDADVMLQHVGPRARKLSGLAGLRKLLERERRRSASKAKKILARRRRRKVLRALRRYFRRAAVLDMSPANRKPAPFRVRDFTHEELWHYYDLARVYEMRLVDGKNHPDSLHQYRSSCRRLRFAIELFGEALPKTTDIVAHLHELQRQIGDMHDHHVAVTSIRRWVSCGELRPSPTLARYVEQREHARDELRRRHEAEWLEVMGLGFRERLAEALEVERLSERADDKSGAHSNISVNGAAHDVSPAASLSDGDDSPERKA